MSDWPRRTVEEIAEKVAMGPFGSSIKVNTFVPEGVPVISGQHLNEVKVTDRDFNFVTEEHADRLANANVHAGDVIFTHAGNIGQVAYIGLSAAYDRYVISQRQFYMRCDTEQATPEYVTYYFRSPQGQHDLLANRSSTGVPSISRPVTYLRTISIPVPPLEEQRAIASVLGALDDKIEQNRRTAQALEKLAQAIFRAWFVDFEPVKAKAAGATSFPSMPQPVFDALPTRLVDSAIGPVPEGWAGGAIKDFAKLSKAQIKPQQHPDESFDHFSIPAFDASMRAVVEPGGAIKSNKFLVVDGCVLLSKLNPRIARIWLPPPMRNRRQIASTEFLVFVPNRAADRHYLYCQFQQREFRDELAQSASGTSNSHQRVRPKDVLTHPVVMPAPSIRKAFAGIADPLFALRLANHDESAKLAQMRDYLLPKLLSGQVRVQDAERAASTVA